MGLYDRQYLRDDEQAPRYSGPRSVVITLIIINAAIFLLDAFSPSIEGVGLRQISYWMALDTAAPWKLWTYLTSGFAHSPIDSRSSIFHIGFNMFALFIFGRAIEERLGAAEFIRYYLIAIVFASTAWMLVESFTRDGRAMAVGASGGVAAVVILFVLNYPRQTLMLFGVVPMPAWLLGVMMIFLDLLNAMRDDSPVGWAAHLGGAAFAGLYFKMKWNFSALPLPNLKNRLGPRRHLRVHRPEAEDDLEQEADKVLAKLHREGESSLTKRERKILERYSRIVQAKRRD